MKFHRFDSLSFLAGIVITGIGLAFLLSPRLRDIFDLATGAASWFWPAVFIAIGIAVLAPVATRARPNSEKASDQETGDLNAP